MKVILFFCALAVLSLPARADEKADLLLQKLVRATQSVQTLTADLELSYQTPGKGRNVAKGTVRLMRPNYAFITLSGEPTQTLASDGKNLYLLNASNRYEQKKADSQGANVDSPWWGIPFRYFFTQMLGVFGPLAPGQARTRYVGMQMSDGKSVKVVEQAVAGEQPYTLTLFIGVDHLLRRSIVRFGQGTGAATFEAVLTNVQRNTPLRARDFAFRPPTGALPAETAQAQLLAPGTSAPEFTLPTPNGKPFSLVDTVKRNKATLVNFWYVNCAPCRREFPQFQRLYNRLRDKGLAIVAINYNDPADQVRAFVQRNRYTFPVVLAQAGPDSVFSQYKVSTFPVNYLIDANGKVVKTFIGYEDTSDLRELEAALKQMDIEL